MRHGLILLACLGLLTGCASRTLYSWGSYESQLYAMYSTPDSATPELQILKLEEDIQKARAKDHKLPPGFYAHLGFLYYQQGQRDLAKRAFETEKAAFPESTVFMDRLIARL
ncbi:MAG: DUF4810 domain-containing protein [Kiritimatiellaceae bacterium]|nr:DUF4810 domain-containing protein [Kiritimatiellaceae bacterium]